MQDHIGESPPFQAGDVRTEVKIQEIKIEQRKMGQALQRPDERNCGDKEVDRRCEEDPDEDNSKIGKIALKIVKILRLILFLLYSHHK